MDGITLDDMKCFDFSVPLDETIIYDDSDEDDKKTIILISENDAPDIPEHSTFKSENSSRYETTNIVEPKKYQQQHMRDIDIDMLPASENLLQYQTKNIKQVKNLQNIENRNDTKKTESKSSSKVEKKKSKLRKKKKSTKSVKKNKKSDIVSTYFTHVTSKTVGSSTKENTVIKNSSEGGNVNEDAGNIMTICPSSTNKRNNIEDSVISNTDNCGEITDYILDTLSRNLILSVKAYHQHLNKCNNSKSDQDNAALQDSKKRYLSFKYHYFQLSYCAVISIILPQETKNNLRFTEQFLSNTVKYGKEKMNLVLDITDLKPFYYELVAWAKRKKDSLENDHNHIQELADAQNQEKTKIQTPLLAKQLAQPPLPFQVLPEYSSIRKAVGQQTHTTPTFRKGAPDREVIISVDTSTTTTVVTNLANQLTEPIYSSVCNLSSTDSRPELHYQDKYHPKNPNLNQGITSNIIIHPPRDFNGAAENIESYGSLPVSYNNSIFQYNYPAPPIGPKTCYGQFMDHYQRTIHPKPPPPCSGLSNHVPCIPSNQYSNQVPYPQAHEYPNQISYSQPHQYSARYDKTFNIQAKDKIYQTQAIKKGNQNHPNDDIYQSQANERLHHSQVNDKIRQNQVNDRTHQSPANERIHQSQVNNRFHQSQVNDRIHQSQVNDIIHQSQANERIQNNRIHQNQVNDIIHQSQANDKIYHGQTALRDQYRQNEQLNELNQSIERSRSSVSTDSGFISPSQFNSVMEPLVSPLSSDDRRLVPLITHVTSLNPKAMQIAEGTCHVCQKRTKKKCLGCYQIYYCSTTCQLRDWTIHKVSCTA